MVDGKRVAQAPRQILLYVVRQSAEIRADQRGRQAAFKRNAVVHIISHKQRQKPDFLCRVGQRDSLRKRQHHLHGGIHQEGMNITHCAQQGAGGGKMHLLAHLHPRKIVRQMNGEVLLRKVDGQPLPSQFDALPGSGKVILIKRIAGRMRRRKAVGLAVQQHGKIKHFLRRVAKCAMGPDPRGNLRRSGTVGTADKERILRPQILNQIAAVNLFRLVQHQQKQFIDLVAVKVQAILRQYV